MRQSPNSWGSDEHLNAALSRPRVVRLHEDLNDALDRRTAKIDAEFQLMQMRRYQFLIDRLESFATHTDLSKAEEMRLRNRYHQLYVQAVGIPPNFRDEYRTRMEAIIANPEIEKVEDVIQEIRRRAFLGPLPKE